MLRHFVSTSLAVFDLGVLAYFLVLNCLYIGFTAIALVTLILHRLRWTPRVLDALMRSPDTPGISVIVPAYNEETTICDSVRALLLLNYPQFEIVVVNDGATDRTLQVLVEQYDLLPAPAAYQTAVATQPVRRVYRSVAHPDLVAIDKTNGGKADAINAGINAARYALVCIIDADSILEDQALTRALLPFIEDPTTLAVGGFVRIANGCQVTGGRVTRVGLPRSWLARFQIVEYLRAFMAGRVALSRGNLQLIISGAFGLFRRSAVVDAGGFRADTIGEDMEIVVRLHRRARERGQPYRIVFQPDPVCWTEAPETPRALASQRNRWQRGTLQTLTQHRHMMLNPRYGAVGVFSMPYYLVFETCGPVLECVGFVTTVAAVALGLLDWRFAELYFLVAVACGALLSVSAVLLEDITFRRYPKVSDLLLLSLVGILENLGYRQLTTWWRLQGTVDFFRRKHSWGAMPRKGFSQP